MNVYIHIEWTKRELDSNLLLATIAAEKGAEVSILDYNTFNFLFKRKFIKPGVFHSKSLVHDDNKQKFFEKLKKSDFVLTCIDEESGLIHNEDNLLSFFKSRFTKEALKTIDAVFCWGNYDFEFLNSYFKDFSKKIILSGSPRVDMWKKNFKNYWSYEKKINEKYVLISSNFAVVNSSIDLWKIYYKLRQAGYFERNNKKKDQFIERASQSLKLFYKFVDATNFLTENFKDIKFLLRPHPQESLEVWRHLLTKRKNLIIDNKESINSVLNNSICLIHNGCTTAYEAALNDIPSICYNPLKEDLLHGKPANDLGVTVNDLTNLKSKVMDIDSQGYQRKEYCKKELAIKKLNYNENILSSSTIVNEWSKYLNKYKKNEWWFFKFIFLFFFQKFKKIIFTISLFYKREKNKKKILGETKFENFNRRYYQNKIDKICEILNLKSNIKVYKIVDNHILIKKVTND
jgi:surface carbohydrate biosynthesis protein